MRVGATLLVIAKNTGGIRPIAAVGYMWRRLTAKVAGNYIKAASAAFLAARKLGFDVTKGVYKDFRTSSKMLRRQHAAAPAISENRLQECF
jgi:hypothetical protein